MNQSNNSNTGDSSQVIQLKPVGVVRNRSQEASWGASYSALTWQERAARMKAQNQAVSELVINTGLDSILDGIDDFSHLMVLYWAHLVPDEKRSVTRVHPLGSKDFPLVGVFATHSPVRPNSILVTVVRLIARHGNTLKVAGLDALDGSPILDIKPYLPDHQDPRDVRMPDWMRKMYEAFRRNEISSGGTTSA
jgi:tRNA-Thr(GGU) m(6)t(6)A37 methyltransferase TsaA